MWPRKYWDRVHKSFVQLYTPTITCRVLAYVGKSSFALSVLWITAGRLSDTTKVCFRINFIMRWIQRGKKKSIILAARLVKGFEFNSLKNKSPSSARLLSVRFYTAQDVTVRKSTSYQQYNNNTSANWPRIAYGAKIKLNNYPLQIVPNGRSAIYGVRVRVQKRQILPGKFPTTKS